MEDRIASDKATYRRDITEFTPDWKEEQSALQELLMRAKFNLLTAI